MKGKSDQTYSIPQNLWFLLKEIAAYDKKIFLYAILASVSGMLLPLVTLGLTAVVIEAVAGAQAVEELVAIFIGLLVLTFIFTGLSKTNTIKLGTQGNIFRVYILNRLAIHLTAIDFSLFDGDKGQEKINKAFDTASSPNQAFQYSFMVMESLIKNVLGFLLYSYILADIHWIFIILVAATSIINFFYSLHVNKKEDENKEVVSPITRKIKYLTEQTGNFQKAKDMRLYKMEDWFGAVFSQLSKEKYFHTEKIVKRKFAGNALAGFFKLTIDLAAYVFLINMIINGEISVASFTVYFGAIATLSQWISGLLKNASDLNKMALEIDNYREFIEIESQMNHGEGIAINQKGAFPYLIEFDDVSYRYPGAEKDTITQFSLKIQPGEKVALVGVNGAGKSTLIKLLTGLYRPTEGTIKINEHKIDDYNIDEYFDLFSVVFQDYYELPITIEEMVVQGQEEDNYRLKIVEEQSGLSEVIEDLPKGRDTNLVKRINPDGVDLSGGQKQKIQLAKALYKDGPILILDEPTAALDPIAESEIYQKYEELSKNKTSIFISHRLSSTRFCDRIIFIEDGRIIEEGTHKELMSHKGKYYDMYETQSYYYKDEVGERHHAIS